jgi:hypothetical protein
MNGELYLAMLPQLNSGTAELLDNKIIRAQALSLERHTARGHQCRCGCHRPGRSSVAGRSAHAAAFSFAFAQAMSRDRTQDTMIRRRTDK